MSVAEQYRWDDFLLDVDAFRLTRGGVPLALEPKAIDLLVLMVRRPNHLFSKQEIFATVWPDTAVTDHALTRIVAQLRRALGDEAREARYIATVPTRGYRWIRPLADTSQTAAAPAGSDANVAALPPAPPSKRIAPGLTAFLAIAAAVLFAVFWTQRGVPTSATGASPAAKDVSWPVQVTTHAGLDFQPALSPDGDSVAYVSDVTGRLEIYVRPLSGPAGELALTSDGNQNIQPAWSPDGRTIAYHSYARGGIWVIPARGGNARQLVPEGSNPAWSPDSARLVFQSDEHTDISPSGYGAQSGSTIWIVDAAGGPARPLSRAGDPIGGHANPVWTNDGRHVAFSVFDAGANNGIWITDVATGVTRALERGTGLFELAFAPDDSALFVAGGDAAIIRFPFDRASGTIAGPRAVIAVAGVPRVRGLTIAADGGRIAFAGLALSSQIWLQRLDRDGAGEGPATPLTSDTSRRNSFPVVSPDGTRVAYVSTRAGEPPNVWVMGIDGHGGTQLTANETADQKPTWYPDNRRIAYISNRGGTVGVWAIDTVTRREERVLRLSDVEEQIGEGSRLQGRLAELELAPSMNEVAFSVSAPPAGRRVVYRSRLGAFAPQELGDPSISTGYPSWSPDGRRLAVQLKDGSATHVGIIDAATGRLRKLTNSRGQTWVRSWSPDGRRLAAAVLRDGRWSLQWIEVESGRHGVITPPGPPHVYMRYPSWSSNADLVVFERGEVRGNIWTLTVR